MALRRKRTVAEVSALKAHFDEPFTPAHDESKPPPTARALCKHCGASVSYSTTRLSSRVGCCTAYDHRPAPSDDSMAAPPVSTGELGGTVVGAVCQSRGTLELDATLRDMATEMDSIVADVVAKEDAMRLQEARIDAEVQLLTELKTDVQRGNYSSRRDGPAPKRRAVATSSVVTLNVGGTRFMTADDTLLAWGSFFETLLSSPPNSDGEYFLDMNANLFPRILRLLRTTNPVDTEGLLHMEKTELEIEWPPQ